MIELLKCEFKKTRRRYIFLTAIVITVIELFWGLYGNSSDTVIEHGWMIFLYQFPMVNTIFLPLLSIIVASRLCDLEHKGSTLKQLCTLTQKGKLYDAKLLYGLAIISFATFITWLVPVIFGKIKGFSGDFPRNLYLLYFLFTLAPTVVIYIFQHSLSLLFKNQAIPFFIGVIGEFAGLFSMFLPQLPFLRKSLLWGYYGALQFVGMFGWTKESRWDYVYFEVMHIDWAFFAVLVMVSVVIYLIGRKIFCEREV